MLRENEMRLNQGEKIGKTRRALGSQGRTTTGGVVCMAG
jgi:hypothetical protein